MDKNSHKADFKRQLDECAKNLKTYVSTESGDWTIKGFIDIYKNIYTISSDTKIVSKILEIHIFPQILQFAESIGYTVVLAEKQNWYPDLTFIYRENPEIKFALETSKRHFGEMTKQQVLRWEVMAAILGKERKTKTFNFPTINIQGIIVWGLFILETIGANLHRRRKFTPFGKFRKNMSCQVKKSECGE